MAVNRITTKVELTKRQIQNIISVAQAGARALEGTYDMTEHCGACNVTNPKGLDGENCHGDDCFLVGTQDDLEHLAVRLKKLI